MPGLRGLVPACSRGRNRRACLIVEEGKDLVLPDRPTDAAAKLVIAIFIPQFTPRVAWQMPVKGWMPLDRSSVDTRSIPDECS